MKLQLFRYDTLLVLRSLVRSILWCMKINAVTNNFVKIPLSTGTNTYSDLQA